MNLKSSIPIRRRVWFLLAALVLIGFSPATLWAADDLRIFSDQRNNGWDDWSWVPRYNTNSPVHSGTNALCFNQTGTYQALWFKHGEIDTRIYTNLTLWVNGGVTGGQYVGVNGELGGSTAGLPRLSVTAVANSWQKFTFTLAALGVANKTNLTAIQIWNGGTLQTPFYLDDISLAAAPSHGKTIFDYDPLSIGGLAYLAAAKKLLHGLKR